MSEPIATPAVRCRSRNEPGERGPTAASTGRAPAIGCTAGNADEPPTRSPRRPGHPGHWLRAALAKADISEILASARLLGCSAARLLDSARVTARAGYFAEAFGRPDIAAASADLHPKAAVRLGDPAEPLHARDTRFGVRDHLGVAGA